MQCMVTNSGDSLVVVRDFPDKDECFIYSQVRHISLLAGITLAPSKRCKLTQSRIDRACARGSSVCLKQSEAVTESQQQQSEPDPAHQMHWPLRLVRRLLWLPLS